MKKLFLSIFFYTLILTCYGKVYFVKDEINFKAIIPNLKPGDEVKILDGVYSNWSIEIPAIGTAEKPILINAEHSGKVIFSNEVNKPIFQVTGKFIVLSNLTFTNCILQKGGLLIEFKNSSNCTLTHCSFFNNQAKVQFTPLVVVSGTGNQNQIAQCDFASNIDNQEVQVKITKEACPQNTLITKNSFKNKVKVSWANGNGGECVQIGQDPVLLGTLEANTVVSSNQFIACNGENEVISNKSSKNQYLRNQFQDCNGELVMRGGHDCIIEANQIIGGNSGIRINGTGHQIINNNITNVKTAVRLMYGMAKGKEEIGFYIAASNCVIRNNQIINATTGILIGDSKDADWTGKFDTKRYPSPVLQNVAPFSNEVAKNQFKETRKTVVYN
jgi:poly(beta-D-mannuronate) lyase